MTVITEHMMELITNEESLKMATRTCVYTLYIRMFMYARKMLFGNPIKSQINFATQQSPFKFTSREWIILPISSTG